MSMSLEEWERQQSEIERLRAANGSLTNDFADKVAENDRLREERDRIRDYADSADRDQVRTEQENKQLRDDRRRWYEVAKLHAGSHESAMSSYLTQTRPILSDLKG
jgi:FtsZ-binding cell division protein ZapB